MIYYPTYFCNVSKERHIVKDKYYCECGKKYNAFYLFNKNDLRNIKFKQLTEINCPQCRAIIK